MKAYALGLFAASIGLALSVGCAKTPSGGTGTTGTAAQKLAGTRSNVDAGLIKDKSADTPKMRQDNAAMAGKIYQVLLASGVDVRGVEVVSNYYIVHLRGSVASDSVKAQIEATARRAISPEFSLSNELQVSY